MSTASQPANALPIAKRSDQRPGKTDPDYMTSSSIELWQVDEASKANVDYNLYFSVRRAAPPPSTPLNDKIDALINARVVPLLATFTNWVCCLIGDWDNLREDVAVCIVIFAREADVDSIRALVPDRLLTANVLVLEDEQYPEQDWPDLPGNGYCVRPGDSIGSLGSEDTSSAVAIFVEDAAGQLFAITTASGVAGSTTIVSPSRFHANILKSPEGIEFAQMLAAEGNKFPDLPREIGDPERPLAEELLALGESRIVGQRIVSLLGKEHLRDSLAYKIHNQALIKIFPSCCATTNHSMNEIKWNGWTIVSAAEPSSELLVQKTGPILGMKSGKVSKYRARRSIVFHDQRVIVEDCCVFANQSGRVFSTSAEAGCALFSAGTYKDKKLPSIVGIVTGCTNYRHEFGHLTFFTPWSDIMTRFSGVGYNLRLPTWCRPREYAVWPWADWQGAVSAM